MNAYLAVFVFSVVIASFSQLLLKTSADRKHANLLREYLNWRVITAYLMLIMTTPMIIYGFRKIDLKNGPIIQSLGYVFVLILERFFLKQKITRNKVVGIILIVAGIIIFNLR